VSQPNSEKAVRFPSTQIEDVVVGEIRQMIQSRQRLLDALGLSSIAITNLEAVDRRLSLLLDNVTSAVPTIVRRVVIKADELEIQISKSALRAFITEGAITEANPCDDLFALCVEVQFLKYRGKVRLILHPDSPHAKKAEVPSLIRAIARAHAWVDQIVKGEALNQRAIAASLGVNKRYVSKILPLAFLAPDITEMILEGGQPSGLSISDCSNMSLLWNEHRKALEYVGTKSN
jgi:site-specific DNA recombinase